MTEAPAWLEIRRGTAPLLMCFPHTGTELTSELAPRFSSVWLARKDADHWVHLLYEFAHALGASSVRTAISRSVIDVNRDPSGASLYPGQATTELCPTTTFDGEPLYRAGQEPDAEDIARRTETYFAPYHAALCDQLERVRGAHGIAVLYDAHSIRSRISRLFSGELPQFNIGTNDGRTCASELTEAVEVVCAATPHSRVVNGRFKGGWTTRHYGKPEGGVHAIQMELSCRGYMDEVDALTPESWPTPYSEARAAAMRAVLKDVLGACVAFARARA